MLWRCRTGEGNGREERDGRAKQSVLAWLVAQVVLEQSGVTGDKRHRVTLHNRGGVTLEVCDEETIYEACLKAGIQIPIACNYGGCITCAGKLVSGKVRQPKGTALNRRQAKEGYILMCVARPKEDCVIDVGVETHGRLYANPFAKPANRDIVEKAQGRGRR